jgi:SAM-dependent methyltransferase
MKEHWENIYATKRPDEVSWTEEVPSLSLKLIEDVLNDKTQAVIDVGGGDSNLVDYLQDKGFEDITVLDISGKAIERAKERLGNKADGIKWIESDIKEFIPTRQYAIWHDRAAFHFLTDENDIDNYVKLANNAIADGGYLIIGAFATNGPLKCSGLPITQYSDELFEKAFARYFVKQHCELHEHTTPFNTTQNFIFCVFKKA